MADPVAEKVGVTPETGAFEASFSVIVTVEVAMPLATTGLVPVIDEFASTTVTGEKITVPSLFEKGETSESVFVSAVFDFRVQVEIPLTPLKEQKP